MITGDENLVHTETVIQYRIKNVADYLFNVRQAPEALKIAAEASVRRVVANHNLDDVLTDQKDAIQTEILSDLQTICDEYGLGVEIIKVALQDVYAPEEVADAFTDVIKAREDMNRYINEAQKKANEIVPAAEAKQQEILNEAKHTRRRIADQGDGKTSGRYWQYPGSRVTGPDVPETMREFS